VPDGFIDLRWWKDGDTIYYRLNHPAGYSVEVENLTGMKIIRKY